MYSVIEKIVKRCKQVVLRSFSSLTNNQTTRPSNGETMKVLNVAEKNDAAKNIASILGRGNCRRREGYSVYNKIYEFSCTVWNQNCQMVMTSVSGHLLTYEFAQSFRGWRNCHPSALFDAPVFKICPDNFKNIKKTLETEIRTCDTLIIWTDCDREGENIGFEIIKVCQDIKPNINVYRAVFSEITGTSINRALQNLVRPDKLASDAVDVRSELDLRIGAAFTRFQTLRLQQVFPRSLTEMLISYGSCQFPTLGFVVERFLAIEKFVSEPYWKIRVTDDRDGLCVEFRWARNRVFEKLSCEIFLDTCLENPQALVEKVQSKPKSKWRPLPLDTVELEKQGSRKLRLSAKETMKIAEKLYSQGFISYPRTETNIFPKELNLVPLVTEQTQHNVWGAFAQRVLDEGVSPRQGKKSDQAHPPIHPIKFTNSLQGNEAKVYEFVVRHFLACVSKNAEGYETIVDIDINGEQFTTSGLQIIAKNYLEVYIYEKWNAKEIHQYEMGQRFRPTEIKMVEEKTSPPNLLTEADLIALMDKHGIGTDATHAEHIDTVKQRHYVGMQDDKHLIPGKLGIGLVMGYDKMGFNMSKPNLRAELERDLKLICQGQKNPQEVLQTQIEKYREVFRIAVEKANLIDTALADYLDEAPATAQIVDSTEPPNPFVMKCPKCGADMVLRSRREGGKKFISCSSFPGCKNALWFPDTVENVTVLDQSCRNCNPPVKKIEVKFVRVVNPIFGLVYEACLGCDDMFKQFTGMDNQGSRNGNQSQRGSSADSGYQTSQSNSNRSRPQSNTTSRTQPNASRNVASSSRSRSSSNTRNPAPTNNAFNSTQNSSNSSNQQWNNNIGVIRNDDILCDCHQQAIELTVRKEGPNQGRKFFKCAKPQNEGCNFFLWKDQNNQGGSRSAPSNPPPPPPPAGGSNRRNAPSSRNTKENWSSNQRNQSSSNSNGSADDGSENVMCNCGQPAKKLTVLKESANKGRQFYACPAGMSNSCGFFQWADETQNNNQQFQPSTSRGRGRGQSYSQRGAGASQRKPRATGGKRKCGICGQEGHTRKTCRNGGDNDDD